MKKVTVTITLPEQPQPLASPTDTRSDTPTALDSALSIFGNALMSRSIESWEERATSPTTAEIIYYIEGDLEAVFTDWVETGEIFSVFSSSLADGAPADEQNSRLLELAEISVSSEEYDPNSWVEPWQAKFQETLRVTEATPLFTIVPRIESAVAETPLPHIPPSHCPSPGKIILSIAPGLCFGTGTHETTRLCLLALESIADQYTGARCLDVGTGSGILSIAARLLFARSVMGIDIDPLSAKVAEENSSFHLFPTFETASPNASTTPDSLAFSSTPLEEVAGEFEVIVANILSGTLKLLLPSMRALLAPGGTIILSGILIEEEEDFLSYLKEAAQITPSVVLHQGEWLALILKDKA